MSMQPNLTAAPPPQLQVEQHRSGFTLVQVTIMLAVLAVLATAALPGGQKGSNTRKANDTVSRYQAIDHALIGYMLRYGHLPCPADGSKPTNDQNFGKEAATPGTCTGGSPAANFGPSGNVVAGTLPTKTLILPDDFAFDDWGRRITYAVDTRATLTSSCLSLQSSGTPGVTIKDGSGTTLDNVMYAYISHGPDGHGAFPGNGSNVAGRINIGATDAATIDNASVNAAFATNFDNVFVQKQATATFDDLVYYNQTYKHTCCLGAACVPVGFRIDRYGVYLRAIADINCDGIPDLIFGYGYVVFGTANGWPIPPAGLDITTLNGTNGFTIVNAGNAVNPTVGDLNGDGCADIISGGQVTAWVMFGGPGAWPATVNTANFNGFTGVNGTSGVHVDGSNCNAGSGFFDGCFYNQYDTTFAIADVDGDGYNDIIGFALVACNGPCSVVTPSAGFVIFGKPNTGAGNTWQNTPSIALKDLDGTNGFQMYASNYAQYIWAWNLPVGPAADYNHDGYADILLSGKYVNGVHVVYGRSRANWQAVLLPPGVGTAPAILDLSGEEPATPNRGTFFSGGLLNGSFGTIIYKPLDANGGGFPDMVFDVGHTFAVLYGRNDGANWPASVDITTAVQVAGKGFIWDDSAKPGWLNGDPGNEMFADVNGDGRADLLVGYGGVSPLGRSGAGASLVMYQPVSGWPSTVRYSDFLWDGTDSFQIYGPVANSYCTNGTFAFVADVRPGDGGKPEILINCNIGEPGIPATYGIFGKTTWPASFDLNDLN
jgi:type II secretory pathway pseudopilin PulG